MIDEPDKRRCKGRKANGDPCGAWPLRPGTVIDGVAARGLWCRGHDPELPSRTPLTAEDRARGGEAHRKVKPMEIERRLLESRAVAWMRPYWRILGFDIHLDDDGELVLTERPEGGAKLYGTSAKDGAVHVSEHDDLGAQMAAAEKLRDRAFGRPTSRSEFSGKVEQRNADQLDALVERELARLAERPAPGPHPDPEPPSPPQSSPSEPPDADDEGCGPAEAASVAATTPAAAEDEPAEPKPVEASEPPRRPGWQRRELRDIESY